MTLSKPTSVNAKAVSPTSARVQWAYSGDRPYDFEIQFKRDDSSTWLPGGTETPDDHDKTVGNLTPGLKYNFRVRARRGVSNIGPWSNVDNAWTPNATPTDPPVTPPPTPTPIDYGVKDLRGEYNRDRRQVDLLYTIKAADRTPYRVERRVSDAGNWMPIVGVTDTNGDVHVGHPAGAYEYRVVDVHGAPSNVILVSDAVVTPPIDPPPVDPPDDFPPVDDTPVVVEPGGAKIPNGRAIPDGERVVWLERGGKFRLDQWGGPATFILGAYGDPALSEPEILCYEGSPFDLTSSAQLSDLRLRSASSSATAIRLAGKGIVIANVYLVGPEWYHFFKIADGAEDVLVEGFGSDADIRGHAVYDDSHGGARNLMFDMKGGVMRRSREENLFRIKAVDTLTLRGGTAYSHLPVTNGTAQKAWLTVQAAPGSPGPRNIVVEDMETSGPAGGGPIKTASGWQKPPVRGLTLQRIKSDRAFGFKFEPGLYDCVLRDITDYFVVQDTPIRFGSGNPNHPTSGPTVRLERVHIRGNSSRLAGTGGKVIGDGVSTYNGKIIP